MKVAMVSEHASPLAILGGVDAGGQNVHVAALATALGRLGHRVVVHTRRTDPDLPRRHPLTSEVVVDHVPAGPAEPVLKDALWPLMDRFADDLRRQWSRERPDVVHAHFWMSGWAALRAAGTLGIPVIQTFHALGVVKRRNQGLKDTSPPPRLAIERRIVRKVDQVVATCSDEVRELLALGADMDRLAVVPCGVDLDRFSSTGPAEERPYGRTRIVVVSRLVERKGIGNVIEAAAGLPDVEVVVAGGPPAGRLGADPEARRLQRLAADLGMADRLVLRGQVERASLPALLRSADLVVCVPWYEPFGMVALEAMACGVPVVASAVGGLTDTVIDGVTGAHVAPRHPEQLRQVLRQLLSDPSCRRRMGVEGSLRARRHYGWPAVGSGTTAVYREVIERATASTAGRPARADALVRP